MSSVSSRVSALTGTQEQSRPAYRRRRFFLPQTSQPRLLLSAQFVLAGVGLLASGALYLLVNRDLTDSYFSAHLAIRNVQQIFLPYLVGINLLVFLLSVVAMVFYTHRIAGPMYRLCRVLQGVARGELYHRVRFRRRDYLQEVAADANEALSFLQRQVQELKYATARLSMELEMMERAGQVPSNWEALLAVSQELQDTLARFQLNGLAEEAHAPTPRA